VLIAVTATGVGFAFDAGGGKELTNVFAGLYVVGCVAAVLMVRQSAIFTAVVQPPMILFVSVPGAYFLFHDGKVNGLKDILINCAYPLIERFPLMVFTSGTVLLIGLARWLFGSRRSETEAEPVTAKATAKKATKAKSSPFAGVKAKITRYFSPPPADDEDEADAVPTRRHAAGKPAPTRSRRKSATERAERADRTERIDRADSPRRRPRPPVDDDEMPRRRSSPARARNSYEPLRNPYERREPLERPAQYERRSRRDAYDPVEAYDVPPRRRPDAKSAAVPNGSHHPISRVRYRGSSETETRQERSRSRPWEADSWEYDI
jgi:hypothetical protein